MRDSLRHNWFNLYSQNVGTRLFLNIIITRIEIYMLEFSEENGSKTNAACDLSIFVIFYLYNDTRIYVLYMFWQELECSQLQNLLFCMHAFLTAKVAAVDPTFLTSTTP